MKKHGPQGPQKLSSLKSHKIRNPPLIPGIFLSKYGWQTRKERQIEPQNNRGMTEKAKRPVSEGVSL